MTIFNKEGESLGFQIAKSCGANFLAKNEDGSCVYLKEGKCGIHERRPAACRKFFCTTKDRKYQSMVKELKNADVEKISSICKWRPNKKCVGIILL